MEWINDLRQAGDHAVRLDTDLEYFAAELLKIRPKAGSLVPFIFNPAQRELHRIIEEQRARTGRVRVIVLKARQLGISTYVAARFFRRTIANPGLRTAIIGHERAASRNLFGLVKRFYDHLPEDQKPSLGVSNQEELVFNSLDSGYLVSVATLDGSGRSSTAQLLHASEAAFWVDLPTQLAALMQTVPDIDGSEIILETTAFGYNDFHKLWRKAESGASEFIAAFQPWSIDPAYRARLPDDFVMTAEETKLAELHDLDAEQIMWRRNKISGFGSDELFCQEYPLIASEAFVAANFDSYIPADLVLKARREDIVPSGPLTIGVDPAGKGADRTAIAWRQGSCITKIEARRGLDTMEVAGLVASIIIKDKPIRVNIDVGGLGVGVYDRLVEQGHGRVVKAVNFGGKPIEPPPYDETGKPAGGPANRRAELYFNLRKQLEGRFKLPDSTSLQGDLTSIGYKFNSSGQLLLESKEDMRRRGVPSPDEGDAVALCFTEPDGAPTPRSRNIHRKIEYPNMGWV